MSHDQFSIERILQHHLQIRANYLETRVKKGQGTHHQVHYLYSTVNKHTVHTILLIPYAAGG